jgi:hypothetical protein
MVFLWLSVQFGMNHNGNWRTDEFFRGLGGSTTKQFKWLLPTMEIQ